MWLIYCTFYDLLLYIVYSGYVTITDLSSCLSLMETNIKENEGILMKGEGEGGGGMVEAKVLVW